MLKILNTIILATVYCVTMGTVWLLSAGLRSLFDSIKKSISSFSNRKSSDSRRNRKRVNRQNLLPRCLPSWLCMRGDEVIMRTESIEKQIDNCYEKIKYSEQVIRTGFLQGRPGRGKTTFPTLLKQEIESSGKKVTYQSFLGVVGDQFQNSGVVELRNRFSSLMSRAQREGSQYVIMGVEEADSVIEKNNYNRYTDKMDMLNFYKALADYNDDSSNSENTVPQCVDTVLILFTTNLPIKRIDDALLSRSIFTVENFDPATDDERKAIWLINYLRQRPDGLKEELERDHVMNVVKKVSGEFRRETDLRTITSEAGRVARGDSSSTSDPLDDGIRQLTASVGRQQLTI